jgi:putative methyltransferase (TIGR04325 family)
MEVYITRKVKYFFSLPLKILKKIFFASSKNSSQWYGNFSSWASAKESTLGYESEVILTKCKNAMMKVKSGEAVYERDSVTFKKKDFNFSLLACLGAVALDDDGRLNVLDFGGSLGSSYYQHRDFLNTLKSVLWSVVEQKHFAECGRNHFRNEELNFYNSIEDSMLRNKPNCIVLSSVLQYLEKPIDFIKSILLLEIEYIIIDRTAFVKREHSIIAIQNVPKEIYEASYPCWFFNEIQFLEEFTFTYDLIADFDDRITMPCYIDNYECYWKGFFFKKNSVLSKAV